MKLEANKFYSLPFGEAVTPKTGKCIANNYWLVNDNGLLFFHLYRGDFTPQCNKDEGVAKYIKRQNIDIYKKCKIQLVPIVYLGQSMPKRVIQED